MNVILKNPLKQISCLLLLSSALYSCQPQENTTIETVEIDPISDPNYFAGGHKAKAMVLGVFHFSNPGLDSYKEVFEFNILEEQRQVELNELIEKLTSYKPTKILLEVNRETGDSLINAQYQGYLAGSFDISEKTSEDYQIGFRLAKALSHKRVYATDSRVKRCGAKIDWDTYDYEAYLKEMGQYEKASRYNFEPFYRQDDSLKSVQSLVEHLSVINDPANRLKDQQAYLTEGILEGAGDNYLGADFVARWYHRNLRIFANAYDFTDFDKEDRLLVMYGAGHVWHLRQFFTESPEYDYIEVNEYLKSKTN